MMIRTATMNLQKIIKKMKKMLFWR